MAAACADIRAWQLGSNDKLSRQNMGLLNWVQILVLTHAITAALLRRASGQVVPAPMKSGSGVF
jgi:hypothetical protein